MGRPADRPIPPTRGGAGTGDGARGRGVGREGEDPWKAGGAAARRPRTWGPGVTPYPHTGVRRGARVTPSRPVRARPQGRKLSATGAIIIVGRQAFGVTNRKNGTGKALGLPGPPASLLHIRPQAGDVKATRTAPPRWPESIAGEWRRPCRRRRTGLRGCLARPCAESCESRRSGGRP